MFGRGYRTTSGEGSRGMANVSELFDELIARAVQLSDKYDVVRVTDVVQLLVAVKQLAAQAQTPPVINAALCVL
jgi:hypothetical protein